MSHKDSILQHPFQIALAMLVGLVIGSLPVALLDHYQNPQDLQRVPREVTLPQPHATHEGLPSVMPHDPYGGTCYSNMAVPVVVQKPVRQESGFVLYDSVWAEISRHYPGEGDQGVADYLRILQEDMPSFNLNVVQPGFTFMMGRGGGISGLQGNMFHDLGRAASWQWCRNYWR